MSSTSRKDAERVIEWIQSNSGYWNSGLLEVRDSSLGGVGVFATDDIDPDSEKPTVLLRVAKTSLLSPKTSFIDNLLHDTGIEGALALVLAVIYERDQREKSPWYEYLQTIHCGDDDTQLLLPPSSWSQKERGLLKGSELEVMGALDDEENKEVYERACTFALSQSEEMNGLLPIPWEFDIVGKDDKLLFEKYRKFVSISNAVAARDFEIDAFHHVALVPGADLFNHSLRPNARFETTFDVCEMCGASGGCSHMDHGSESDYSDDDQGSDSEDQEDQLDKETIEVEIKDAKTTVIDELLISNLEDDLNSKRKEIENLKSEDADKNLDHEPALIFFEGQQVDDDDCVDLVLRKSVKKGQEIFNTYGDFSNSILLPKYGFVIPANKFDTVGLGLQILRYRKQNKKMYTKHFSWWESEGYESFSEYLHRKKNECCEDDNCQDGCCSDDECDAGEQAGDEVDGVPNWTLEMQVSSTGKPSDLTFGLLRLLSLNQLELNKFLKNPEKVNLQVLTTKHPKVYKLLKNLVESRLQEYDSSINYKKYINSKNHRERMAAQLVMHEQEILREALQLASKKS